MDQSILLPQKLCRRCGKSVMAAVPFIKLCKKSDKKWHQIIDYMNQTRVADNTKNLYIAVDDEDIKTMTDTARRGTTKRAKDAKQALRNFKTRLRRLRSYQNRTERERIITRNAELKCPECKTAFGGVLELRNHLRDTEMRVCADCKQVVNVEQLKKHLSSHGVVAYSCRICSDTFDQESLLAKHMNRSHVHASAFCPHCKRSFRSAPGLSNHIKKTHTPQICTGCKGSFSNRRCYMRHARNCSNPNVKPALYVCDYCSKEYAFKTSLTTHIVTVHLKGRSFQCHECGKTFLSEAGLSEHGNTHNWVEDRYVCDICGCKYSTKRGYRKHRKRHLDDGSLSALDADVKCHTFSCHVCHSTFRRVKSLQVHLKAKHGVTAT